MAELLLDLSMYLVDRGYANGDGLDVFRDYKPEEPNDIIILSEYPGDPYDANLGIANRSVQVCVRNSDPDIAQTKALSLFKLFSTMPNEKVQITDDRWCMFYLRQTPFRLGTDDKQRVMRAFNMGVTTNIE